MSLITAQNSESAFSVRAALAEIRLDQESSKGSAGMTGRLNVFRKFVRFDIRGVTPVAQLANLKVSYSIKEGDSIKTMEDSVSITTGAAAFIVDMAGFEDKFGTDVKSKSNSSKITSTKYIHDEADIVALKVVITDQTGHALYVAGWPEAPIETVILPERLKPRTFTSLDGRKIKATIAAKGEDTVTLQINGKRFKMELSKLSEPDREFLNGIPNVAMIPEVPSTKKTVDEFTLLGKTITYPHERRPDFMIKVQFKKMQWQHLLDWETIKLDGPMNKGTIPRSIFIGAISKVPQKKEAATESISTQMVKPPRFQNQRVIIQSRPR